MKNKDKNIIIENEKNGNETFYTNKDYDNNNIENYNNKIIIRNNEDLKIYNLYNDFNEDKNKNNL